MNQIIVALAGESVTTAARIEALQSADPRFSHMIDDYARLNKQLRRAEMLVPFSGHEHWEALRRERRVLRRQILGIVDY